MQIRAIVFDLDNTLIPSERAYEYALNKTLNEALMRGYLPARAAVKARLAPAPSARNRLIYFKEILDQQKKFSSSELLSLMNQYETSLAQYLTQDWQKKSYGDFLKKLSARYKLGIVTNENLRTQLIKLTVIDPRAEIFSSIVTSEECGVEKPNKKIFEQLLQKLNLRPQDCAFVGDSLHDDIQGSQALGFAKVFYTQEFAAHSAEPGELAPSVITIKSLTEIEKYLQ